MKRVSWGTRFGFYFAAVGSAFGLGNLWRFPYIVSENGGGAFVLVYIFLTFIIGLSLMLGELMLGKISHRSVSSAMAQRHTVNSKPTRWRFAAAFTVMICLVVLAYYAVISGWVLHFAIRLGVSFILGHGPDPSAIFPMLRDNGLLQVTLMSGHLLLCTIVVLKGLEQGLERWVGYVTPVFALLLVLLIVNALSFPTTTIALRYLFYPDFAGLRWSSLVQALGHVFFTLSVGFGSMVTFGSYLREGERIPGAALRVTTLDTVISLLAGLLIFPVMLSSNITAGSSEVMFQTLPVLVSQMDKGLLFGVAFFVCLYMGALTSSITLFESIVANLIDKLKFSRGQASWWTLGVTWTAALLPALATTTFRGFHIRGKNLIEWLDGVIINWGLPLSALGICLYVGYVLPEAQKEEAFIIDAPSGKLYANWRMVIRYFAPALILLALSLQLVGLVKE